MKPPSAASKSARCRNLAALTVCILACSAMVGDIFGSRVVKGLGAVSAIAPFPKVFCEFEGMEGFASDFFVCFDIGDECRCVPITPELYARLAGPYNRRNVYGAALAGGPKLPRALWEPVFRYGFAEQGPLRREFGVPLNATNLVVIVRSKTRAAQEEWLLTTTQ